MYIYIYETSLLAVKNGVTSIDAMLHLEPEVAQIAHDVYSRHIKIKHITLSKLIYFSSKQNIVFNHGCKYLII